MYNLHVVCAHFVLLATEGIIATLLLKVERVEFEKVFGVSIPDDKSEKIGTVGDAIAYIEENSK